MDKNNKEKSKGFCFITYSKESEAENAIKELNGRPFGMTILEVKKAS